MVQIRVTGRHSVLSVGDARRLIQQVLTDANIQVTPEDQVDTRILSGGFSGAMVALVWAPNMDPFVIKASEQTDALHEFEHRQQLTGSDHWLARHSLDQVFGPVRVEHVDTSADWSCICYRYVGSRTYADLESFGDFATFLFNYVLATNPDTTPAGVNVSACLRHAVESLVSGGPISLEKAGRSLTHYLPKIPWETGIQSALIVAASLWSDVDELRDFRTWYEEASEAIRVAPVADLRQLHGDARLANILVDSAHGRVELIDFGNGREGHIFEDLCRFELDLLLSTAPRRPGGRELVQDDTLTTFGFALREDLSLRDLDPADNRHAKCLKLWRNELVGILHGTALPGAAVMYRWFLLVECLRRLRWVGNNGEQNAGVDTATLLRMICALRRRLSGAAQTSDPITTSLDSLRVLHCVGAFVPLAGSERSTNNKRNEVKKAAIVDAKHKHSTVRVLAETGHSYLSHRGALNSEIRGLLAAGGSLQILCHNPYFIEAQGISLSYGLDRRGPKAGLAALDDELSHKFDDSFRGYKSLYEEFGDLIELRVARFGIGATALITEDSCFYEPYFRAQRRRRERLLFDTFELQFKSTSVHIKTLLEETFDFHWGNSDSAQRLPDLERQCAILMEKVFQMWHGPES